MHFLGGNTPRANEFCCKTASLHANKLHTASHFRGYNRKPGTLRSHQHLDNATSLGCAPHKLQNETKSLSLGIHWNSPIGVKHSESVFRAYSAAKVVEHNFEGNLTEIEYITQSHLEACQCLSNFVIHPFKGHPAEHWKDVLLESACSFYFNPCNYVSFFCANQECPDMLTKDAAWPVNLVYFHSSPYVCVGCTVCT